MIRRRFEIGLGRRVGCKWPSIFAPQNKQYKRLFLRVECAVGWSAVVLRGANSCFRPLTPCGLDRERYLKNMTWTSVLIVVALLAILLLLKSGGQISTRDARDYLRTGAVVIDVRSAGEFTAGHLAKAVNIPLSEIETVIARKVKDKNQVLLLHCMSGTRSGEARRKLKALGYTNSFNLGSYGRAAGILNGR
jgi:phage shock protein E